MWVPWSSPYGNCSGVMDPAKDVQQVRRFLEATEDKVNKLKADRYQMDIQIQLERTKSVMNKTTKRHQNDQYISHQRTELDKGAWKDHSDFGKKMERTQIAMLNQVLSDQCAIYDQKIAQERALANSALQKAREENDENTNNKWELFDSMNNQLRAQLEELENECSKLKTLVESLIQREEVRGNMNDEVEDGIYIPRRYIFVITNNECHPVYDFFSYNFSNSLRSNDPYSSDLHMQDVVMRFKLHSVKEFFSDLQMYYDSREDLAEFTITKPMTTIEYFFLSQHLTYYGYIGDAQLYYLNSTPGSVPSTGLIKIDRQEDVDQLVDAHAHERTKIFHLYIVGGPGFNNDEGRPWQPDEEDYRPLESNEEAEQDNASLAMNKHVLQSNEEAKEDDASPAMKKRAVE